MVKQLPRRRRRTPKPFVACARPERDVRVPEPLWDLPLRIEQANARGPRYNQTELADSAGLSQSVVSKLSNWTSLYGIRIDTIYKLASALDVSVPWLLGESKTKRAGKRRPSSPEHALQALATMRRAAKKAGLKA